MANGTLAVLEGTNTCLSGKVIHTVDLGTHTLFLADVTDGEVLSQDPSVTYAFYQKNIKVNQKPSSGSPEKKGWICTVCGYIYEGEELPADFVCPWCNHDASYFEKRG